MILPTLLHRSSSSCRRYGVTAPYVVAPVPACCCRYRLIDMVAADSDATLLPHRVYYLDFMILLLILLLSFSSFAFHARGSLTICHLLFIHDTLFLLRCRAFSFSDNILAATSFSDKSYVLVEAKSALLSFQRVSEERVEISRVMAYADIFERHPHILSVPLLSYYDITILFSSYHKIKMQSI